MADEVKLSDLAPEERECILKMLCMRQHFSIQSLCIALELEIASHNPRKQVSYGETVMDKADRLDNRLVADLVLTDMGIPEHDAEALAWLDNVRKLAKVPPPC